MKYAYLLFLCLTSFCYSFAQNTVSGSYVTKTNNTINAKIIVPSSIFVAEDLSKLFFKVKIVDSIKGAITLKPEDINSFEFLLNGKQYQFYAKPFNAKNNLRFLQSLVIGPKSSLYWAQTVNQNGAVVGTFYTFEKADGTYAFLINTMRLDKFKTELKEFYKDNLEVQQIIDAKFQSKAVLHSDIIEILQTVNRITSKE